jgi:uncharacterized membrane protein
MNVNIFKMYGSIIGAISLIFGIVLLFLKRLDTVLTDKELTPKEVKAKRIVIAIAAIAAGILSISAALGWIPLRGGSRL